MTDMAELLIKDDLSGVELSGASLGGRDLRGKNLRGADLSHAHLGGADLTGADLRNANLYKANLGAAKLVGADLRYSDLREANLSGCDLTGADLREAQGLHLDSPVPLAEFVRPLTFEETEDFQKAKEAGFYPLSYWGQSYAGNDGNTLYKNRSTWLLLKERLGDAIFGDRKTFAEVRLVRQYKEYSQWAYMISKRGFERIAKQMNLTLKKKA
ncbi:MAG: pentapeptide repeat-containing protein [Acidobacteriota bacterium]|nr:pentapeptide repeat-containing protein [Acidobacteriota bacterium]